MLVAARKHFHTDEELVAELDERTGAIQIFGVRRVVAEVADPDKEISLEDARETRSGGRNRRRNPRPPSRPMRWAGSPPKPPSR